MKRAYDGSNDAASTKQRRTDGANHPQSFPVAHRSQYCGKFPYFRRPVEIGSFSLDESRCFHGNRSELRYFIDPHGNENNFSGSPEKLRKLNLDLSAGYKTCINRDETVPEKLDTLLQWILENKDKFSPGASAGKAINSTSAEFSGRNDKVNPDKVNSESKNLNVSAASVDSLNADGRSQGHNNSANQSEEKDSGNSNNSNVKSDENWTANLCTDFVCWRGLLTKILCTPFERRDGWCLIAGRFGGTIYLCEWDIRVKDPSKSIEAEEKDKLMTYWGVKFEQYVTSESSTSLPDVSQPVNTNKAFVSVVRTRLEQHSLVFGGEVDCCDVLNPKKYYELKTSRIIDNQRQMNNFKRFKLLKWWAQSFLIGIDQIICGFRNDDGFVQKLKSYGTLEIPKFCEDVNDWTADAAFNFCNDLLHHIKRSVIQDYNKSLYVFNWRPNQPITCEFVSPDSKYAFLPLWFTQADSHLKS